MKNSTQAMLNVARVPKRHENDLSRVKHIVRKAAALFVFAMLVACAATPAMAAGLRKITEIQGGGGASKSVGTGADPKYVAKSPDRTIYFGNYWQNPRNMTSSSDVSDYDKEGIQWRVLSNDQTGMGKVLLLADQGLYATSFDANSQNKWESSVVRTKLNNRGKTGETNAGFAGDAFSEKEWSAIMSTDLTDVNATDKLFLLSKKEAEDLSNLYGLNGNDKRKASPTAFAKSVKMYGNGDVAFVSDSGAAWWWLRSPGSVAYSAYNVYYVGYVSDYVGVVTGRGAARVAFNLNQESVLFLSAAVGGKTSVAAGNGFKLADYDGSQGWKMTMNDAYEETSNPDGIKAPTDVTVTQQPMFGGVDDLAKAAAEGGTVDLTNGVTASYSAPTVTYTAAAVTEGKANCVSAIVKDSAGNYVNYAKISSEDKETDKKVPFGDLADGRYTMFIFAEAASGDKQTDYASDFSNENGYEFIKGSGETVKTGNLSKEYKDKNITINLGGGFDLGFENDTYVTQIKVVEGNIATITGYTSDAKPAGFMAAINTILDTEIAAETDGTTLTGKVTVEKGAQVTCCRKITFKDLEVNGNLTIENGAVVEVKKVQTGEDGAIFMKENATIVNNSGKDITVKVIISGKEPREVTVKDGETYNPSQEKPDPSKGGSSVGCNAGFGIAMLLSAAAAMLCKRKRG